MPARSSARNALHAATAAFALTVLAGCAILPEPTASEVQAQALGRVAIPPNWSAEASAARVEDGWLASFDDPALSRLVYEALENNPDLWIASARLEQANAQVDLAEAQLKPAVGILGRAGSKPVADLVALLSGVMLRMSWEIDLWGRMRYARNAARAGRDATGADYRYAQQSLAAAVARAWFLASQTRLQEQLAAEMVGASRGLVEMSEQRRRVGVGTDSDVLAARANLATYEDAQQQVQLAHRQALRALELLLGRYPGATLAASDRLTPFPGPVPAGIPMDALNRRPDLVAAERRVVAAFDRVGEAKASMLPALSLSAGYGRISNEALEVRDDLEQTTSSTSATAVIPLYTGGALTAQVGVRTAEQKAAVADYARRALVALGEVEDALNADRVLAERERLLGEAAAASRDVARLEQDAYRVGKSDLRAVNQRQLAQWAADVALLQVRRERLSRRVDLHLALGGSFGEAPARGDESVSALSPDPPPRNEPMKGAATMKPRHSAMLAAAMLASAALECGAVEPLDTFSARIGGYISDFDTKVRADGQSSDGTRIDLERDLGVDQSNAIAIVAVTWRPWEKHEFGLSYYRDDGSAERRIDRDIEFDGTVYEVSSVVRANVDLDAYEAYYTWWAADRDTWVMGPRLGLVWYRIGVGLSLEVDANGNQVGGSISDSVDFDLPAPSIGGSWRWVPGGSDWRLSADVGYFAANIDNIDADVTFGRFGVEWFPWENWGASLDYTLRRIDADADRTSFDGNFRFVDQGLRLGVVYRF